jgi:hypothetical protein
MLKFAQPIPIKFNGVFDTVGALGVPFPLLRRLRGSAYPFLNTGLRLNNEYAFHALAIDEHRKAFAPTRPSTSPCSTAGARIIPTGHQSCSHGWRRNRSIWERLPARCARIIQR